MDILDLAAWDNHLPTFKELEEQGFINGWGLGHSDEAWFRKLSDAFNVRMKYVATFSFALPCSDVFDAMARHSKTLVEIGAGSGFWARLMTKHGFDIVATNYGTEHDYKLPVGTLHPVLDMEASEAVVAYPERDVLCIWPSLGEDWLAKAAEKMKPGRLLFYIGEGHGGCTANDAFFDLVEGDGFERVEWVRLNQFWGIHDELCIYRRV